MKSFGFFVHHIFSKFQPFLFWFYLIAWFIVCWFFNLLKNAHRQFVLVFGLLFFIVFFLLIGKVSITGPTSWILSGWGSDNSALYCQFQKHDSPDLCKYRNWLGIYWLISFYSFTWSGFCLCFLTLLSNTSPYSWTLWLFLPLSDNWVFILRAWFMG